METDRDLINSFNEDNKQIQKDQDQIQGKINTKNGIMSKKNSDKNGKKNQKNRVKFKQEISTFSYLYEPYSSKSNSNIHVHAESENKNPELKEPENGEIKIQINSHDFDLHKNRKVKEQENDNNIPQNRLQALVAGGKSPRPIPSYFTQISDPNNDTKNIHKPKFESFSQITERTNEQQSSSRRGASSQFLLPNSKTKFESLNSNEKNETGDNNKINSEN